MGKKTLKNTTSDDTSKNIKDIKFWGDGDAFKLLSKAYSEKEGWMKSTKAMQINDVGCVIQVTTQQGDNIAEALTFVPGVEIRANVNRGGDVIKRFLTAIRDL